MTALYDVTILLSIGLAAVLGAVFAVAITFLGSSIEQYRLARARQEEEDLQEAAARVTRLKQALEDESSEQALTKIKKELDQARWAGRRKRLRRAILDPLPNPNSLGVYGSVVAPGLMFILAAGLSAVAKARIDASVAGSMGWRGVGLFALGVGIAFLLQSLREVERAATPSVQANYRNMVDAFKQGMAEREMEMQPVCVVTCDGDLPIRMEPEEQRTVRFRIRVEEGHPAHNAQMWVFVSPGISILEPPSVVVADVVGFSYIGWTRAEVMEGETLRHGAIPNRSITIRAPAESGTYEIGYNLVYDEGATGTQHGVLPGFPIVAEAK